jgi:hypothetical protein
MSGWPAVGALGLQCFWIVVLVARGAFRDGSHDAQSSDPRGLG